MSGFNFAYEQVKVTSINNTINKNNINNESLSSEFLNIINIGKERCTDFQNRKYSEVFLSRVEKILSIINKEDPKVLAVAENIVRRLALWMTYEDIPELLN